MKIQKFFLLTILGIMFLTACIREDSADVNQDKIHARYELIYKANEDKTYARAIFRFSHVGGTKLELTAPSQVTFNGDLLTFQSGLAEYEKQYAGYVSSGTFVWTDLNDVTFTNTVQNNTIALPATLDTIPRDAAFEIFWVGDSLKANERVRVASLAAVYATQNNVNAQSVIIPLNTLQNVIQGEYNVWLERIFEPAVAEKTSAGGFMFVKYLAMPKAVYFD